jgi:hypothetical protein
MATGTKLAFLNAWTITGSIPTSFTVTGSQLLNCINWTEFNGLDSVQQNNLLVLCNNPGPILGGSANLTHMADGMMLSYFTSSNSATIASLTALAQGAVVPWYIENGYPGPLNNQDLSAAGLS